MIVHSFFLCLDFLKIAIIVIWQCEYIFLLFLLRKMKGYLCNILLNGVWNSKCGDQKDPNLLKSNYSSIRDCLKIMANSLFWLVGNCNIKILIGSRRNLFFIFDFNKTRLWHFQLSQLAFWWCNFYLIK